MSESSSFSFASELRRIEIMVKGMSGSYCAKREQIDDILFWG